MNFVQMKFVLKKRKFLSSLFPAQPTSLPPLSSFLLGPASPSHRPTIPPPFSLSPPGGARLSAPPPTSSRFRLPPCRRRRPSPSPRPHVSSSLPLHSPSMPSGALAPPPHFPLPFPLPSLQRSRHHAPFMATMAGPHPSVAPLPLPAFPIPLGLQNLHSSPDRSPFSTSSPRLCSTALQSSAATTKLGPPPSIRRLAASPSTPTTAGVLSGGELRCPPISPRVCAFPHRRLLTGVSRPGLAAVGSPRPLHRLVDSPFEFADDFTSSSASPSRSQARDTGFGHPGELHHPPPPCAVALRTPGPRDLAINSIGLPSARASSPSNSRAKPWPGAPDSAAPAIRRRLHRPPARNAARRAASVALSRAASHPEPITAVGSGSGGSDRSKTRLILVNQSRPHHFCKEAPAIFAN